MTNEAGTITDNVPTTPTITMRCVSCGRSIVPEEVCAFCKKETAVSGLNDRHEHAPDTGPWERLPCDEPEVETPPLGKLYLFFAALMVMTVGRGGGAFLLALILLAVLGATVGAFLKVPKSGHPITTLIEVLLKWSVLLIVAMAPVTLILMLAYGGQGR
ncbi:hypothetical protein [Methyloversatilis sp.]|uniref:hypothetical protein n=1 Tax=Methyloversatilis sp. TaxID=2569862 RepID=UPI0035AF64A3